MLTRADIDRRFDRARRHTWVVRTLRVSLPFVTVAVVGLYLASAMISLDVVEKLAQLPVPSINAENITMDNPRYEGFTKDGGAYVVQARTARQDFKNTELIHLNEITGEMTDARKVRTEMTAARGVFHSKTNRLKLLDGIAITSSDGMAGDLTSASINPKRGVIISKEPSVIKMRQGQIASDELMIWQKQRKVVFAGNIQTRLTPPPAEQSASAETAPAQDDGEGSSLLLAGNSNEPVDITSNLMRVEDLKSTASFIGDVRAVQAGQTLSTARLDVFYENNDPQGRSAPGAAAASGKVQRMSSRYPVVITRAEGERITAETLDVDVPNEVAVLSGNVAMQSGAERHARSDKAEIHARNDTALLTGNVVLVQGANEVRGQRLLIDRKQGTSQLTSPATAPQGADGRIFAKLKGTPGKAADENKPQDKVDEVKGAITAFTFKTDPNAPVDIEADELMVKEAQKVAEFHGDVRAKQGGFTVRTAKLVAHYTGGSGLFDPSSSSADKKAAGGEAGAQLTRISALGKVLVSSTGDQSATGDWAEFDVAANTVTLGGDVVLTQGKNIIRGTQLKIDMTTGNSVIDTAPEAAGAGWASTLQAKNGSASKVPLPGGMAVRGGRPSAVFYPTQFKQPGKSDDDKAGSAGAGGWDTKSERD